MQNKKGQELTLGTVVLIVLGVVVLVFLIFGFSTGWGNLWDRITNFAGGKVNLDTVRSGCALACTQNSIDDFCTLQRKVNFPEALKSADFEGKKTVTGSCQYFVKEKDNFPGLNIESCPGLCE